MKNLTLIATISFIISGCASTANFSPMTSASYPQEHKLADVIYIRDIADFKSCNNLVIGTVKANVNSHYISTGEAREVAAEWGATHLLVGTPSDLYIALRVSCTPTISARTVDPWDDNGYEADAIVGPWKAQ